MRDDEALLVDMYEHARDLVAATASLTREAFDADLLKRMGVAHVLQVIGEAARQLSEPGRQRFPGVPWPQVVGMRHRLVHEYFRIDFDLVWVTAARDVPALLAALEPVVRPIIESRRPKPDTP